MTTIVQNYGPIYGEVVNGTVEGRPNGSVYVPKSNTIALTLDANYRYFILYSYFVRLSNSSGAVSSSYVANVVAESQDLASNIYFGLYEDAACTDLVCQSSLAAGIFNGSERNFSFVGSPTFVDGQTYYLRAQLINNSTPVATSDVIPVVAINP